MTASDFLLERPSALSAASPRSCSSFEFVIKRCRRTRPAGAIVLLGYGTHVMGIAPANCPTIEDPVKAEQLWMIRFLELGENRQHCLESRILSKVDDNSSGS